MIAECPKLTEILRSLPVKELDALVARLGIKIDQAKRIDPISQVARVLSSVPELRDPSRLPAPCLDLLHRIAENGGVLKAAHLSQALEPLIARGIVYVRGAKGQYELLLPAAFIVQMRPWEGENPRGLRALLAQASQDAQGAIAAHYLGKPAPPPIALALEGAWSLLSNPKKLAEELAKLPASERRVLENVDREGGEVYTDELLELEREPIRLRTVSGSAPSRRGIGFSLERRGFLIPLHPNRHVVPDEISKIISADAHAERKTRRAELKALVGAEDNAPRRARFALDPMPTAVALALAAREGQAEFRPGVGTPRSLVQKLAVRFGREPQATAMLIALSRSSGLWDASALNTASVPGVLTLGELPLHLYRAWRRGGAWDEARPDPETLRLAADARDPSPAGLVREMLIQALRELGADRWLPWQSLAHYLKSDDRVPGMTRLLRRWAERVGVDVLEPVALAHRMVFESLPALGLLDLGDEDGEGGGAAIRLTPRGRNVLADKSWSDDGTPSKFLDSHVLRLAPSARIAQVLMLGPFVEVGKISDGLDLIVAPQTLARAISAGYESDALRQRIESIAKLPEGLSRTLAAASVVLGRADFVQTVGFLWIQDRNVRELLATRKATADLFVDPSPEGGLLIAPHVEFEKLIRRVRTVGVEITQDGQVLKAKTMPPPAVRSLTPGAMASQPPGPGGQAAADLKLPSMPPLPQFAAVKIARDEEE